MMRSIGSSRRQNTARLTITSTSRIQTRFHASETTTLTSFARCTNRKCPTDGRAQKSREDPASTRNKRAFSWANHEKTSPAIPLDAWTTGGTGCVRSCSVNRRQGRGEDFAVVTGCGHSRATASRRQAYLSRQRMGGPSRWLACRRANRILGALTAPHSLYSQVAAPEWRQTPWACRE